MRDPVINMGRMNVAAMRLIELQYYGKSRAPSVDNFTQYFPL
jgi:hypothetical protein